jgi:hypothetical protein
VNVVVLHLPAWFAKVWWISSSRASIVACGIQVSAQSNVVHVAQKVALSDVALLNSNFCQELRFRNEPSGAEKENLQPKLDFEIFRLIYR